LAGAAIIVGVAHEARRARLRAAVVPELARAGVEADTFGLTPVGLVATVALGHERGDDWVRVRFGEGWFGRPVGFHARDLDEDRVPFVVERLRHLGGVRSIQLLGRTPGEGTLRALHEALPGALIVVVTPSGERRIGRRRGWFPIREDVPGDR
jgi:hypothetical protein